MTICDEYTSGYSTCEYYLVDPYTSWIFSLDPLDISPDRYYHRKHPKYYRSEKIWNDTIWWEK